MKLRNILLCLLSSFTWRAARRAVAKRRLVALCIGGFLLLTPSAFPQGPLQGSLTPPGPPGPTMKTLDQVEARTIVNAANTPGDASNLFIISAPGSYYLTGNIIGASGKSGILINADHVTLDLNGFALIGVSGSITGIITGGLSTQICASITALPQAGALQASI